jgi:hypothetical protein
VPDGLIINASQILSLFQEKLPEYLMRLKPVITPHLIPGLKPGAMNEDRYRKGRNENAKDAK